MKNYKNMLKKSLIITAVFTSFTTPLIANANFEQLPEQSRIYQAEQNNYFNHKWEHIANSMDGSIIRYSSDFIRFADVNDSTSFVTYISGEVPDSQVQALTQAFSTHLLKQLDDIKYVVTLEQFDIKSKTHRIEKTQLFNKDGELIYEDKSTGETQKLKESFVPTPQLITYRAVKFRIENKPFFEEVKTKPWYNSNTKKFVPVAKII